MSLRTFALRFLALVLLATWFGGFTVYSAVVIPELHEVLGNLEAGSVTRRVTLSLNAIGASAVAAWWILIALERRERLYDLLRLRSGLLAATSAVLVVLVILHRFMSTHLDTEGLRGFYPLHRAYLIASTAQWFLNLALLAASLVAWYPRPTTGE
jgi:hypothetical protein